MKSIGATKVEDYGRFTIYKINDPRESSPFIAEGKSGRGMAVPDGAATSEEMRKKLDKYK